MEITHDLDTSAYQTNEFHSIGHRTSLCIMHMRIVNPKKILFIPIISRISSYSLSYSLFFPPQLKSVSNQSFILQDPIVINQLLKYPDMYVVVMSLPSGYQVV